MGYLIDGIPREVIGAAVRFQPSGAYMVAFAYEVGPDDVSGKRPGGYVALGVGNDATVTERLSWADDTPLPEGIFSGATWIHLPGYVAAGVFSETFGAEIMGAVGGSEGPSEGSAEGEQSEEA